ncbi:MAG: histidine phosphatase family protein [Dermatophilaceae bacterium]
MRLVIVRHGETDWTLAGRYTGTTEVGLTANGRAQAASLPSLLERVLHGERAVLVSSPRKRATETAALALSSHHMTVEPLVAEYDYGDYEGLTEGDVQRLAPGWDIWRDGCPGGESTAEVGWRADTFLRANAETGSRPVLVVTHGHFSRILAARALGLSPDNGRLFASATGAVSLIEDRHGERCVGLWNVDAALLTDPAGRTAHRDDPRADPLPAGGRLP